MVCDLIVPHDHHHDHHDTTFYPFDTNFRPFHHQKPFNALGKGTPTEFPDAEKEKEIQGNFAPPMDHIFPSSYDCSRCCMPSPRGCSAKITALQFAYGVKDLKRSEFYKSCENINCHHPTAGCGWQTYHLPTDTWNVKELRKKIKKYPELPHCRPCDDMRNNPDVHDGDIVGCRTNLARLKRIPAAVSLQPQLPKYPQRIPLVADVKVKIPPLELPNDGGNLVTYKVPNDGNPLTYLTKINLEAWNNSHINEERDLQYYAYKHPDHEQKMVSENPYLGPKEKYVQDAGYLLKENVQKPLTWKDVAAKEPGIQPASEEPGVQQVQPISEPPPLGEAQFM